MKPYQWNVSRCSVVCREWFFPIPYHSEWSPLYKARNSLYCQFHLWSLGSCSPTPFGREKDSSGTLQRKDRLGWPRPWEHKNNVGEMEERASCSGGIISSKMLQTCKFRSHHKCRITSLLWCQHSRLWPVFLPEVEKWSRPNPLLICHW